MLGMLYALDIVLSLIHIFKAEVSSIDFASSYAVNVGGNYRVPPLRTRKAEAVVDMPSGETMAIGGLISSEESKNITKVPLLGDIPILGKDVYKRQA